MKIDLGKFSQSGRKEISDQLVEYYNIRDYNEKNITRYRSVKRIPKLVLQIPGHANFIVKK